MITATVDDAGLRAGLARIIGAVKRPRAIMAAVGMEGAVRLRKHYLERDRANPNKLGGKRQHFWLQVRRSVQNPAVAGDGTRASISITDPRIGHKVRGGTIRPKRTKFLAIPAEPDAYGLAPRVYERETGFKLVFLRARGRPILARMVESGGLQVEYLLRTSVTQQADPQALPDMSPGSPFLNALLQRAEAAAARLGD